MPRWLRARARVLLALLLGVLAITAWRVALHGEASAGASNAISASRDDGGLRLTISVPRWRFFRNELVPVTLVLSNRSGGPIQYMGQAGSGFASVCYGSPLNAAMTRDGQYIAALSVMGVMPSCPATRHPYTSLAEGKSLQVMVPLALPASGRLTMTAQAQFAPGQRVESRGLLPAGTMPDGLRRLFPGLVSSTHAPFAAGWVSLAFMVSPHIPPGRMLRLARRGHSVGVYGDPQALRHLMVQESSAWAVPQGECAEGAPVWSSLSGAVVQDLTCPGAESQEKWRLLVAAPGYAVAGAVYCFTPVPGMVFGRIGGMPQETQPPCTERIVERGA